MGKSLIFSNGGRRGRYVEIHDERVVIFFLSFFNYLYSGDEVKRMRKNEYFSRIFFGYSKSSEKK